jgi:uncharacterized membrane protein YqjE
MAKSDKKKSKKSSKKKAGRFRTGYKAVMTDRVKLLLIGLAVVSFVVVVIIAVWKG